MLNNIGLLHSWAGRHKACNDREECISTNGNVGDVFTVTLRNTPGKGNASVNGNGTVEKAAKPVALLFVVEQSLLHDGPEDRTS